MSWVLEKLLLALAESKKQGGRDGGRENGRGGGLEDRREEAIDFASVKLTRRGVCSAV